MKNTNRNEDVKNHNNNIKEIRDINRPLLPKYLM